MTTCEHITDQLLDYLYGLLEEDESAKVRAHLAACSACQVALAEAKGQQKAFSQAAQVCRDVKPFVAPDFDAPLAEPAAVSAVVPNAIQPALPAQPAAPKVRSPWWMRLSVLALAASVLIAVVVGQTYSTGLTEREKQLSQARTDMQTTEAAYTRAEKDFEDRIRTLPASLEKEAMHLQVSTPAQYRPQASASCVVQITDLVGQPLKAKVQIKAMDSVSKATLAEQDVECNGIQTVQLPSGFAATSGQVVFEATAQTANASAKVETKLRQVAPGYITHLATNKTAYRVGELLFFRTLTLESFSLKPAAKALPLRFSLVSLDGKITKQLPVSETGAGGIGGGEFALTDDLPSGVYYLEVAGQDSGALLQRRRLEIIRDSTPQFVFDRDRYYEGESANITAINRRLSAPVANKDITYRSLDGRGNAIPGLPMQQARTNSQGQANLPLPGNLDSTKALVEIEIHDGKKNEKVIQAIPVVPSKVTVDFYPEGGELVDGLPTRVYYRVSSLQGEPVVPRGKIIFRSSKGILYESPAGQASGVFAFTPSSTESYAVRVTDPQLEIVHSDPVERLGIQAKGLVLSVPTGVTRAGELVRVLLSNKGEAKRLVVLMSCRGQVIQHETVQASEGTTELKLDPPAGSAGVLRVTVYEASPEGLVPLAERLIFRVPAQRLELSVGKLSGLSRGQKGQLNIQCVDEKKRAADFWALAFVIDAKVKSDKERDLPTHFYLAGDVANDDLEQAQVVVRDDPASRQALDVFLGAQGWRRFLAEPEPARFAQLRQDAVAGENKKQVRARAASVPAPVLLSLENASLAQLRAVHGARLTQAVKSARGDFLNLRNDLTKQKETQAAEYQSLASDLRRYQEWPQLYLRQAMSVIALLSLGLGGLLLLVGLINILRQRRATTVFAGSFAAMGLCMVLYFTARQGNDDSTNALSAQLNLRAWPSVPEVQIARGPEATFDSHMLPAGQYSVAAVLAQSANSAQADREQLVMAADAKGGLHAAKLAERAALSNQLGGAGFGGPLQEKEDRFAKAKDRQESQIPPAPLAATTQAPGAAKVPVVKNIAPKQAEPAPRPDELQKKAEGLAMRDSQAMQNSAYVWSKQAQADTILWVPALVGANGTAQLNFDLPNLAAQYRVIIHGHSADGRLGYFEGTLNVK